jgi:pimeloyl-ACP methyl ester carboxylesterase
VSQVKEMGLLIFVFLLAPLAFSQTRETFADLPGVRLWFRDTGGAGAPVVFLHASAGSSLNWEYQIPVFTKAGFRVIAYDRRGWGRSVAQPGADAGTAADDLRALLKFLGVERFHLVATAGGGIVAYDFALSFPAQLRSLVVANSIGGMQDPEYVELGRRLRPPSFLAMPPDLRELGPSYRAADPDGVRRWMELEGKSRQSGAVAQPLRNRMTFSMLESIKTPTLLMTGDADMYLPPVVLQMFASRIKGAQTLVIPEVGHSTYWEKPDVFNQAVLDFIRKH